MYWIYILIAVLIILIICCAIEYKRICFKQQKLLQQKILALQEIYEQQTQDLYNEQKQVQQNFEAYKNHLEEEINYKEEQLKTAIDTSNNILAKLDNEIKNNEEIISQQKKTIDIINEGINAEKQNQQQIDFYRICLTNEQKEDMDTILSIRNKLNDTSLVNKFIYDVYVSKAADAMLKRVIHGEVITGIYKITRLQTGEIYIGQAVDIKKRWQGHIKTACGCGQLASSLLHTTMAQDGVDQFKFEIVEKTTKNKLTEREKFWIDFYNSKNFGLNMRVG